MEKEDDYGDTQGSVWFQVRKKHRSNAKPLAQKVQGESSKKNHATPQNCELEKSQCQLQKVSTETPEVPLKSNKHAEFVGSFVLNQENDRPGEPLLVQTQLSPSDYNFEVPQKAQAQKTDDIDKIRWDDLENQSSVQTEGCKNSSKLIETNSSNPDDNNSLVDDNVACNVPPIENGKLGLDSQDEGELAVEKALLVVVEESLDGPEVDKKSLENSEISFVSEGTNDENKVRDGDVPTKVFSDVLIDNNVGEISGTTGIELSHTPIQDHKSLHQEEFVSENSINESVNMASVEDKKNFSSASSDVSDLEEEESMESKERFRQRLWCFLFENLNRAVDELYLLCELECDLEQMDEANLVLEEAACDFRDLKTRVENFENTKKNSSPLTKDGTQIHGKADHRRPHALSWEVRRMTTSAQKAEILSSSLEAFKKIRLQRTEKTAGERILAFQSVDSISNQISSDCAKFLSAANSECPNNNDQVYKPEMQNINCHADLCESATEKQSTEISSTSETHFFVQNGPLHFKTTASVSSKKNKSESENGLEKQGKSVGQVFQEDKEKEKEKDKQSAAPWKSMDAWKEKRNWADILKSPVRNTSRVSHSPGIIRKGTERGRVLHDKLMSPEKKKKKSALDMKREAEEKHARAMRIRSQLENERAQRLQRTAEKLNRVNEWQAVRSMKLREGMYARHQRSESRHEAYLAQVARRAGDESSKVNEVRFITSLNEENKKLILRQKLHDSEMRRAEKLQEIRIKQKEDIAREEAVLERRKLIETEKMQRLAETQRKKEEAQVRREEERKASSAAREARAVEQLRRKEIREKAQQEEQELLAIKLAERLRESEQRRKFYLEQIRERASMDFRDQSSPLLRRSSNKGSVTSSVLDDFQAACTLSVNNTRNINDQQILKKRIKRIRQRLMALKHEFLEPSVGMENVGAGFRASVGCARAKVGRWLQEMQRLRQDQKGSASICLIVCDMIKFLEGKEPELHASRQAGLLDFISSALPASHTSKPEASQVTLYLLRLLRVLLFLPANRTYFLVQNLLPPIIPMLAASLETYIRAAASSGPVSISGLSCKTTVENFEIISEVLDCCLLVVSSILGHAHFDQQQVQMQEGLVELVVSYQVVHRLRDLFALYDRPQVEGAAFPASILSGLNLLDVLTSRSSLISSRNWESFLSRINVDLECESCQLSTQDLVSKTLFDCQDRTPQIILQNDEISRNMNCSESTGFGDMQFVEEEHSERRFCNKDEKTLIDDGSEKKRNDEGVINGSNETKSEIRKNQSALLLFSSVAETGLVGLPSLLTAVLLQANNRILSEQASYVLPVNFEEVATGVLKVLNNLSVLDISFLQSMLVRTDLKMEFFHLMSFLLSYCTSKWKVSNDKVGLLMIETLLLLGYFALFHRENQEVLRWGKSPTILHKICDLPFVFFSDPELIPILSGTLISACYGSQQNRAVVLQELSLDMLLSLIKSFKQSSLPLQTDTIISLPPDGSNAAHDPSKAQTDPGAARSNRRGPRVSSSNKAGAVSGGGGFVGRSGKPRMLRDGRGPKICDELVVKQNYSTATGGSSSNIVLHQHHRFPVGFLEKAESFFLMGANQ